MTMGEWRTEGYTDYNGIIVADPKYIEHLEEEIAQLKAKNQELVEEIVKLKGTTSSPST